MFNRFSSNFTKTFQDKRKCVGRFRYWKYLSRGFHLRNTPCIFLAIPKSRKTIRISKKPDPRKLIDAL